MQNQPIRWVLAALSFALLLGLGATPVWAQNGGNAQSSAKKEKLKQLKQSFRTGLKAAKTNNHSQAYNQLEQALQLARDTEQGGAENQIMGYLQKLPKNWGNKAIENEDYEQALTHFDKGVTHAENDAYMHYGKGLALVNLDSTEAGLNTLKQAIEVGNRTGNTRVTGLATERIRDEFLAKASKALNAQDPSAAQADTALAAIDEMEQYVEPNAQALFYRARALFEKRSFQEAISTAEAGLEQHQGSRSDAAKYHFIIAESQMNLGNKSTACQTFQRATFGDYKARAEHYLKNECED
jgi:tetratricopeptide (TPR) repeat protein